MNINEYINLTLENTDDEYVWCVIGNPKHQNGIKKRTVKGRN